jgi:RNA polymerase sigma factor (sigma-70 family)
MFKEIQLAEDYENLLIKGCIDWDRESQNKLYKLYSSKMFAVCFKYSKNREEAEDTFHEGFMKVFENIKNFKNEGSFEGWIRRIMVNTAIEKYRRNLNMIIVVSYDDPEYFENEFDEYYSDDILSQIGVNELMEMIQKLPPQYKLVFNLYTFEGLKHSEIAVELGISEGTSKSNLSRARSILQNEINKSMVSLKLTV